MSKNYNTIALGYFNSKGELKAWSSDTFGSPSQYPKTYKDTEKTRNMLLEKAENLDKRKESAENFAKNIGYYNEAAQRIFETSERSNNKFFEENDITHAKIIELELHTDYSGEIYSPIWEDIKNCIDNKNYSYD